MSTAASAPVAEELRRYGLPFVEVREHQGRTAFACKDFQVGDTVIDEKPFVSWEEADSVDGFNMLPPSAKGLERQEQRKQEQRRQEVRALVNVHAEEKEKVGKQASPKKNAVNLPELEFFAPACFLDWRTEFPTAEKFDEVLEAFYPGPPPPEGNAGWQGTKAAILKVCEKMLKVEPLASHPAFSSNKTGASGKDKSSNAERLFAFLRITDINVHKDQEKNTRHGGNSLAGLFVIGSKLGHSCAANCTWTFTPQRRLRYVAVRPILKGEMLTFSYFGDGLNVCGGTMERRLELRKLQFLCACFRCMQGLDFSRGVKCSKCGSERAFLVSRRKKPLSKEDLAKCGKRNDERDDEAQFPFLEAQMDDVPDLADTDFYCGMKFGPDTVTKKSASSATETTSEGVSDSVVDVYFCTSCGYKEQQLTQELKKKEDFLIKSVPSLLDHNSPKGTLPEIVEELERKEAYLGELEQSFGRFHYAWALGCFAWLQSVLALVMRVNRVDLDIALVVSRCVALEEVSRVCFRDCWVQRLRLLGLVAHVQKTLKLFPAQHGGGSSSSSSGVQQLSPLPNLNPLGCKEGANVVKRLLRHADKFEHLNIFQYDVEEDDRMAQGPLQRISYSKPAIESISSELLEGDWRPVVLAGA